MKKFVTTILAIVYLSSSFGATVHLHYCMGKLISWGLTDNNNSKNCTFCNMPKVEGNGNCKVSKKGCCNDKHKQVKTEKDQKATASEFQFSKLFPASDAISHQALPDILFSSYLTGHPTANAPPLTGKQPVFLLNRNFRI